MVAFAFAGPVKSGSFDLTLRQRLQHERLRRTVRFSHFVANYGTPFSKCLDGTFDVG